MVWCPGFLGHTLKTIELGSDGVLQQPNKADNISVPILQSGDRNCWQKQLEKLRCRAAKSPMSQVAELRLKPRWSVSSLAFGYYLVLHLGRAVTPVTEDGSISHLIRWGDALQGILQADSDQLFPNP